MKVLHVYQDLFPKRGGIEDHILSLCRSFSAEITPQILVSNTTHKTIHETIDAVPVTRCGQLMRYFTPICPTMPLAIRRADPDIVHIHLPCPMALVAYLLSSTSAKLVIGYHNDIVQQQKLMRLYRPILQTALRRASAIVSGTHSYAESSTQLQPHRDRWAIIPYGIETNRFERTPSTEQQIAQIKASHPAPRILFTGRLCYYKGVEYLIPAMHTIDATLHIIGVGPWEKRLRALVQQHGLAHKINFIGRVNDEERAAWYHAADALVLPSTWRSEAFGLVQLEAMACGLPIVSSDLPGVSEVNTHGETGLTVPSHDGDALADALNRLLSDRPFSQQLGENGRAKLKQQYQIPRWSSASKRSTDKSASSQVANILSVDVEDWFHGMRFDPADWPSFESRLHVGMNRLLALLDRHDVKATFFVLAPLAQQFPALIRELVALGHEVGTHGMWHRPIFEQTPTQFCEEIRHSITTLQDITGQPIYGHRAPFFSITKQNLWALDVLADCGIRYDSSIFPVHNSRYGIPDAPRQPYQHANGLHELPIATLRMGNLNLPIGGGFYGRFFPSWLLERGVRQLNAAGHPAMLYVHPWELDPQHPIIDGNISRLYRFTHYYQLEKMELRLGQLLSKFHFAPASAVLSSVPMPTSVASGHVHSFPLA